MRACQDSFLRVFTDTSTLPPRRSGQLGIWLLRGLQCLIVAGCLAASPAFARTQVGADIDGEAGGDQAGYAVAVSSDGSMVVVGARLNDGNGSNAGRARVYAFDGDGDGVLDDQDFCPATTAGASVDTYGCVFEDYIGATGPQGHQGLQGPAGLTGPQGPQGQTGATGPAGADGIDGTNGTDGTNGVDGATGAQGLQGIQGETGPAGANGVAGTNGTDGADGVEVATRPTRRRLCV